MQTILIIFLLVFPFLQAKEMKGNCPNFSNQSSTNCFTMDFFTSLNNSEEFEYFEEIARVEFTRFSGVSMFYTYFKNNLALAFSTKEHLFKAIIYCDPSHYFDTFISYTFDLNGCNTLINITAKFDKNVKFADEIIFDSRSIEVQFLEFKDYLILWGCTYNQNTGISDNAAWFLNRKSEKFMLKEDNLREVHVKKIRDYFLNKFDIIFENTDITIDLKRTDSNKACERNDTKELIFKKINKEVKWLKREDKNKIEQTEGNGNTDNKQKMRNILVIFGVFLGFLLVFLAYVLAWKLIIKHLEV